MLVLHIGSSLDCIKILEHSIFGTFNFGTFDLGSKIKRVPK